MHRKLILLIITICIGLILAFSIKEQKNSMTVSIGDRVPVFSLTDQHGKEFNSEEYAGKQAMVIYFYPKDDTPGCTKEACSFRDSYEEFTDRKVKVVGVSGDNVKSHLNFSRKYNLPFTLLADTENQVRELFGVKAGFLGLIPGRVTYVVNKEGKVVYIFENQFKALRHIEEAIKALDTHS